MEENRFIIYMFTSPSGKRYIGQTCNLSVRLSMHKKPNSLNCRGFANAIKKYGFQNLIFEILEENLTLNEANDREIYYIEFYNTQSPNGYNIESGGRNSPCSEETKELIRKIRTGTKASEETKKKMSDSTSGNKNPMWGKFGIDHPGFGKVGDKHHQAKGYIIIYPDGHEELITGLKKFCRDNNLTSCHMINIAKGRDRQHKGFRCRYATPEEIVQK